MPQDPREVTTVAGGLLVLFPVGGFAALAMLGPMLYPLPRLTSLSAILLSLPPSFTFLSCLIPTLLFWTVGIHLFLGTREVPRSSALLFWTLAATTALYFVVLWHHAATWAGIIFINAAALLALWRLLSSARRAPSFRRNLVFHWALVAWLSSVAFPLLTDAINLSR